MKEITINVELFGEKSILKLMEYSESDNKSWRELFESYKKLNELLKKFGARGVNIPEGLSEVAFCLVTGSKRFIEKTKGKSSSSFDTFNTKTNEAEQIKACSVEYDLTSFGPKSKRDTVYFVDFYNNGNLDGTFDIYKIDDSMIKGVKVNQNEFFTDKQATGQRPRFSIKKEIIEKKSLKPIYKNIKIF